MNAQKNPAISSTSQKLMCTPCAVMGRELNRWMWRPKKNDDMAQPAT